LNKGNWFYTFADRGLFEKVVAKTTKTSNIFFFTSTSRQKPIETQTARTNFFGYYSFRDLATGETYIINVISLLRRCLL
jgi:hypothetical protein